MCYGEFAYCAYLGIAFTGVLLAKQNSFVFDNTLRKEIANHLNRD